MPVYFFDALAVGLCLLSAAVFYTGCPNQQWFSKRPLGFYPALAFSLILLVLAWWLLRFHLSGLSTTFALLSMQMLFLGLIPFSARLKTPKDTPRIKSSLTKSESTKLYKAHWWLRICGVLLLGYPLSVGISGLFGLWGPGEVTHDIKSQLAMWLITPLWILPLSLVFFVKKIHRLLVGFLGLNGLVMFLIWISHAGH